MGSKSRKTASKVVKRTRRSRWMKNLQKCRLEAARFRREHGYSLRKRFNEDLKETDPLAVPTLEMEIITIKEEPVEPKTENIEQMHSIDCQTNNHSDVTSPNTFRGVEENISKFTATELLFLSYARQLETFPKVKQMQIKEKIDEIFSYDLVDEV